MKKSQNTDQQISSTNHRKLSVLLAMMRRDGLLKYDSYENVSSISRPKDELP